MFGPEIVIVWLLLALLVSQCCLPQIFSAKVIKAKKPYRKILQYCEICDVKFHKEKEFVRHIHGKVHAEMLKKTTPIDQLWQEFTAGAPNWAEGCEAKDLLKLWSNEELSTLGLKYRKTCLHPSPTLGDLHPFQKARVWRYLRDAMGFSYYPEIASIMAAVDLDELGHLRVKEVFESFETFKVVANFIIASQRTFRQCEQDSEAAATATDIPPTSGEESTASLSSNDTENGHNQDRIESIVELACGHGLIGVLLAYRFPQLQVHLYDLHQRPTFNAFLRAFETHGIKRSGEEKVLPNIQFHEKDLKESVVHIPNSITICIHGCNEVNKDAIELAERYGAKGWLVMPCCILKEMYLGQSCSVLIRDDTMRHNILCGALAREYNAQFVTSIDERITNRPIVVAGGVKVDANKDKDTTNLDQTAELRNAVKRKRIPKLLLN